MSDEIIILEGGDLDYSITVEGNDELTLLAEGIESVRKAFRSQLAHEKLIMDEKMKNLLEHLFKYMVMYDEDGMEHETPQPPRDILFDIISEMCGYLEYNGFTAELRLEWPERNISINTEYMIRIFDNISSNLMKYADRSYNIDIVSESTAESLELNVSNICRQYDTL